MRCAADVALEQADFGGVGAPVAKLSAGSWEATLYAPCRDRSRRLSVAGSLESRFHRSGFDRHCWA